MSDAIGIPSAEIARKRRSRLADFFIRLVKEKPLSTASGIIVFILILVAIFADVFGGVEDWRADGRVRWQFQPLSRWSAVRLPWSRFQPPPHQTQHADFPHYAFLSASRQGLWDLSCRERFRSGPRPPDPVITVQSQPLIQPAPTPPLPTKSLAFQVQPSPSRISFVSGPAVQSAPLSSRLCLPCCQSRYKTAGPLPSTGVTRLPRYYQPLRHPLACQPISRCSRLYDLPCSADFSTGRGGLLQLLSASSSPCRRYHPARVSQRFSQSALRHAAFVLRKRTRPPDLMCSRGYLCVHSRYGPVTRRPPFTVAVSMG